MKTNTLTFKVVQETNGVATATTYSLDTGLNVTSGVKYDDTHKFFVYNPITSTTNILYKRDLLFEQSVVYLI